MRGWKGIRGSEIHKVLRRASFARWLDIDECTNILWLRRMKETMCDGYYFLMYPLFNFRQWRNLSAGVMWECLGVRITART